MNVSWRKGWKQATGERPNYPYAEFENSARVLLVARRSRHREPHIKRWALYSRYGQQVCEGDRLRDLVIGWVEARLDQ